MSDKTMTEQFGASYLLGKSAGELREMVEQLEAELTRLQNERNLLARQYCDEQAKAGRLEDERDEAVASYQDAYNLFELAAKRKRELDAENARLSSEVERLKAQAFQSRVQPWMMACFGPVIAFDKTERNHRFLEEALELVQACGCTQDEAYQLVEYVYSRPTGEPSQEVGGVMVTLAALCLAQGMDMQAAGETELARIWTKVEQIRAKQAEKPRNSPLPAPSLARQAERAGKKVKEAAAKVAETISGGWVTAPTTPELVKTCIADTIRGLDVAAILEKTDDN